MKTVLTQERERERLEREKRRHEREEKMDVDGENADTVPEEELPTCTLHSAAVYLQRIELCSYRLLHRSTTIRLATTQILRYNRVRGALMCS